MQGHSISNVFRCVDGVSGLYLHPWDTSLMLHVFDCVILCFKLCERALHGVMDMGIMIARLLRRKLYAWCNAYRKMVNAKVRNYDLRDLDNEMNKKA